MDRMVKNWLFSKKKWSHWIGILSRLLAVRNRHSRNHRVTGNTYQQCWYVVHPNLRIRVCGWPHDGCSQFWTVRRMLSSHQKQWWCQHERTSGLWGLGLPHLASPPQPWRTFLDCPARIPQKPRCQLPDGLGGIFASRILFHLKSHKKCHVITSQSLLGWRKVMNCQFLKIFCVTQSSQNPTEEWRLLTDFNRLSFTAYLFRLLDHDI